MLLFLYPEVHRPITCVSEWNSRHSCIHLESKVKFYYTTLFFSINDIWKLFPQTFLNQTVTLKTKTKACATVLDETGQSHTLHPAVGQSHLFCRAKHQTISHMQNCSVTIRETTGEARSRDFYWHVLFPLPTNVLQWRDSIPPSHGKTQEIGDVFFTSHLSLEVPKIPFCHILLTFFCNTAYWLKAWILEPDCLRSNPTSISP